MGLRLDPKAAALVKADELWPRDRKGRIRVSVWNGESVNATGYSTGPDGGIKPLVGITPAVELRTWRDNGHEEVAAAGYLHVADLVGYRREQGARNFIRIVNRSENEARVWMRAVSDWGEEGRQRVERRIAPGGVTMVPTRAVLYRPGKAPSDGPNRPTTRWRVEVGTGPKVDVVNVVAWARAGIMSLPVKRMVHSMELADGSR